MDLHTAGIFKRPADVSSIESCQTNNGYKKIKKQPAVSTAESPVEEVARSSRRLPKRSLNKKDAVEEEVFAVDTKTKRRVKKKKSGENSDLIRMVSADDWIKYDPPYGPLTRSRMCNMPSSKTDTKLRKEPNEGRSKKN